MADRRLARNRHGVLVGVDLGRDMDEATFDRLVESGDLTPEPSKAKRKSEK